MAALTNHNVVGTLPDSKAARDVMPRLNGAGIDAEEISLLGKAAEEVTSDPDTRRRDLESTGDLGTSAAKTASLGSVLGGIAGAVALVLPGIGKPLQEARA